MGGFTLRENGMYVRFIWSRGVKGVRGRAVTKAGSPLQRDGPRPLTAAPAPARAWRNRRALRRESEDLVRSMPIPAPFDLEEIVTNIETERGRHSASKALPDHIAPATGICGLWIRHDRHPLDLALHARGGSPWHERHHAGQGARRGAGHAACASWLAPLSSQKGDCRGRAAGPSSLYLDTLPGMCSPRPKGTVRRDTRPPCCTPDTAPPQEDGCTTSPASPRRRAGVSG